MTDGTIDIQWIVNEVLRRLRTDVSTSAKSGQNNAEALHTNGQTTTSPPEELVMQERLITLAALDGRLAGIRRVVVPQRAVVTPAVKDELKQRNVQLLRQDANEAEGSVSQPRNAKLVIAAAITNFDAGALSRSISQPHDVVSCGGSLSEAINQLAGQVGQGRLAVLLSDAPAAAVVLANRHAGVRAALATSFPAVRRAVEEIGANLLIVEPFGRSLSELGALIGEFIQGGRRECPRKYDGVK